MRDIRIHQDCELSTGISITLDEKASRHLTQVLRLVEGDELVLFNGTGMDYPARIGSVSKKCVEVSILDALENHAESKLDVHLYQGISKGDRMDTAIQKSVELGVQRIIPVVCERTVVRTSTERSDKKIAHWQNIVISACEQSGRARIPVVAPILDFNSALDSLTDGQSILLHPNLTDSISNTALDGKRIHLFIGPEGGFSDQEIESAQKSGVKLVSMGKRILRTETAPIAALAVLQARFGDY